MKELDKNNLNMSMLLELRKLGIIDHKILSAVSSFDREDFLPKEFKNLSYEDASLEIFSGVETTSIIDLAKMIFLVLQRNTNTNAALEIGTGSGYQAAVLSKIELHSTILVFK